ncbi:hypothetical protein L4X63_07790 [Geomonas sp. Red32]|uniref:hypothetical protein n=1 Tax=Geomonas sp. Red32 TaxID=2912856 RepID=UPI00202CAB7E|nr:hypothetical protein [Geomonas sp. Red32]MCM0081485.1 hypothetical protein [Geomonas sp. Red32]
MSFFSKLFGGKKDHKSLMAKAEKYLAGERYADARIDFEEALACCPSDAAADRDAILNGMRIAGDRLGELNIEEGDHCARAGDLEKASSHYTLACELASGEEVKGVARQKMQKLGQQAAQPAPVKEKSQGHAHGGAACGSCKDDRREELPPDHSVQLDISEEERFSLLVQPLPGDLPQRYATLGSEFIKAYLLIHDGNDPQALKILKEMLVSGDNDIVIYEIALIMYRAGNIHECERLLGRSLELSPRNPATHLALVHLLADTGRHTLAIEATEKMIEMDILTETAQLMLGDLLHNAGEENAALDAWSKLVANPLWAKAAAERLVPVLSSQGRQEEAKFLAKKYLKGCC